MEITLPTVGAGLAGKTDHLLLRPVLVPCQSGQGDAFETSFGPGLGPGANLFLIGRDQYWTIFDFCFGSKEGKLTRW